MSRGVVKIHQFFFDLFPFTLLSSGAVGMSRGLTWTKKRNSLIDSHLDGNRVRFAWPLRVQSRFRLTFMFTG